MLNSITVNNFAIIDNLELDFSAGMTVLTGETGAGKSIIIDAVQYALGARADSSMVRHGCTRADISVHFDIKHIPHAIDWLQQHELDDAENCLLRRTINADGGSKQFINGQPSTQAQMRELATLLINIHGQHDNQNLGKKHTQQNLLDTFAHSLGLASKNNQTKALDKFAQHGELVKNVQTLYQSWADINTAITEIQGNDNDHSARIELLSYQLQEFEKLDLQKNEITELERDHKMLTCADDLYADCSVAKTIIDGDDEDSINNALQRCIKKISKYSEHNSKIKNSLSMLDQALILTQEATDEISDHLDKIEISPERLQQVETRLTLIHDVARKHKVPPEQLLDKFSSIGTELDHLKNAGQRLTELTAQLAQAEIAYQAVAKKLSQSRLAAAKQFNSAVTKNIHQLGMPGGNFEVSFVPRDKFSQSGLEQTEFLVSANPGQPLKPITKVASGGELSRISLAIEVITAQNTNTPTLIFDEVDVGIGGGTAEIVGKLLKELGEKTQVLCITHLAQVAAQAHHHLQISKLTDGKQTQTQIHELHGEAKIHEIARMLGGVKITQQTLAHAKEMLV